MICGCHHISSSRNWRFFPKISTFWMNWVQIDRLSMHTGLTVLPQSKIKVIQSLMSHERLFPREMFSGRWNNKMQRLYIKWETSISLRRRRNVWLREVVLVWRKQVHVTASLKRSYFSSYNCYPVFYLVLAFLEGNIMTLTYYRIQKPSKWDQCICFWYHPLLQIAAIF